MKPSLTKPFLFAVLLVLGMIVSPVCAAEYTLTGYQEFNVFDVQKEYFTNIQNLTFDRSADDQAITLIHFKVPQDQTVSYTLYYGAANTASGTASCAWNLSLLPLQITTSTIVFNGETKEYSYLDTNPEFDYYMSGYARSSTNETGIIVYNAGYGSFDNDLAIFKPVPNIAGNLLYRVDLSSPYPFDVDISYGTSADVATSVSKSILDIAWDWMNYAISIASFVFGFVVALFYWLKFFFVDNLVMTVSLYLAISMAYTACTCKNVFQFFGKFFQNQKALFDFILSLWRALIEIISSFRAIFRI
jgi:hypothetical protein